MGYKTRVKGSAAQIGNVYKEEQRETQFGAKRRASGKDLPVQPRSVDSMKAPVHSLPPLLVIGKGKDWVDVRRHDGVEIRLWKGVSSEYDTASSLKVGDKFVPGKLTASEKAEVDRMAQAWEDSDRERARKELKEGKISKRLYDNRMRAIDLSEKKRKGQISVAEFEKQKKAILAERQQLESPEFREGYQKGLQDAAVNQCKPDKSKPESWRKGYDAGWKANYKSPVFEEIVLINEDQDVILIDEADSRSRAEAKRRAVMESEEFRLWLQERANTEPMPVDPYQAYMTDLSLKARLKNKPEWANRTNTSDYEPVDYPPSVRGEKTVVIEGAPKTAQAEKTKELLRARSKLIAKQMGVPEVDLQFTTSRTGRARSFYRSGYARNRYTGGMVRVGKPAIVLAITKSGNLYPEQYGVLAHEYGHHKNVTEVERAQGVPGVQRHYELIKRSRSAQNDEERSAWKNADPYMRSGEGRSQQKWVKKWALGTYLGTSPGYEMYKYK